MSFRWARCHLSEAPLVISVGSLSFKRSAPCHFERSREIYFFKKIFGDSDFCRIFAVPFHENESLKYCGNSSVGRARPCQGRGREFESRFPLQTPRSNAGRFCLGDGWSAACPMYKSSLYRKSSAERHFHVQVSRYLPTINQIPIDLI